MTTHITWTPKRLSALLACVFLCTLDWTLAQSPAPVGPPAPPAQSSGATAAPDAATAVLQRRTNKVTQAQREAAAARAAAARRSAQGTAGDTSQSPPAVQFFVPPQGGKPNYYGPEPNWAFSPAPTVDPNTAAITGGIHKFVDKLPRLDPAGANGLVTPGGDPLGQYMPVAVPDTVTYPGSDYYEIELREFAEKMHSDLNPTTLRGYVQVNNGTDTATGLNTVAPAPIHYLGPLIIATRHDPALPPGQAGNGRPVRIKFTNKLPFETGTQNSPRNGDLFLPVDTTEMGAGMGPDGTHSYTQNRATMHLHGGRTPWISDGTPHQWTTPANENTPYPVGVSTKNVPDMPDPGPGSITFFYSNQQSARLMFYHDHAYGITRLNVYAGEAAAYLLTDAVEQDLITRGILPPPADTIALVIQDKTFADPTTVLTTDPTWPFPVDATLSNLWYPHVYMTNQNPNDVDGVNAMGRWDYGPWQWPPWPVANQPITDPNTGVIYPNVPDLSATMEAFHDTPVINGTAYPYLEVDPKPYRFRILNAANDRMWNLQLHLASSIVGGIKVTDGGSGYTAPPLVTITPVAGDTTGKGATALATVDLTPGSPTFGQVTGVNLYTVGSGYTSAPDVTIDPPTTAGGGTAAATATLYDAPTELGMVPAGQGLDAFPPEWTAQTPGQPGDILDGRLGGVPDPALIGPPIIQIGTEGGFLPAPVLWPNTPIGFDRDPRSITITNVKEHNLFIGPAERADVIIDFSAYPGQTLILYNDGPAPVPAADVRVNYFTNDADLTAIGGTTSTLPGYGPNTRTLMQIRVAAGTPQSFDLNALNAEFASTASRQGVFARGQDAIIVPQAPYDSAYNATFPSDTHAYGRIYSTSLTFTPTGATSPVTIPFAPKAIAEEFDDIWGRMSAFLGVEMVFTNGQNQTTIWYDYFDPPTESINNSVLATPIGSTGDGTQIWKVTHNGVDTHTVHFHLFDVQIINRVDWVGVVKPPDANELGWKDTVRMNPLEDCIVALRPSAPAQPFGVPDSVRLLDPTSPQGSTGQFKNVDTQGNPITVINNLVNFGWEYVWHCHILSHEEMDMMRPMVFRVPSVAPLAPVLSATGIGGDTALSWTDGTPFNYSTCSPISTVGNPANEVGFRIMRGTGRGGALTQIAVVPANSTTFIDTGARPGTHRYQVVAYNAAGDAASNIVGVAVTPTIPLAPSNLVGTATIVNFRSDRVALMFRNNATNQTGFLVQRATDAAFTTGLNNTTVNSTVPAGTVLNVVQNGLRRGRTYWWRVRAFNADGASDWSNTFSMTMP
ncbi:MAG TPA: hypothetical protein VMV94_05225 [Phycisphaerae bacterium]|nr:hypothetical protein [Phycisphaerae bacterium]